MAFQFNLYSTPLLFGFTQGCLYAVLFWLRGWRQGRLSDGLFGFLMLAFSFDIWEYMLGFGGVEILWRELNFFPRNFSLLLPPLVYFYLKSQFNADFRLKWTHLQHAIPFFIHALYHILVFAQGRDFVQFWENHVHRPLGLDTVEQALRMTLQIAYFYGAYRLYLQYRSWVPSQFSDAETLSFTWFRNFLIAFLASNVLGWGMTFLDYLVQLDFWHDWWDELFNAALIYYLAIEGFAQKQPRILHFIPTSSMAEKNLQQKPEKMSADELQGWKKKLEDLMLDEKPYLNPELTLPDLAQRIGLNASLLSALINGAFDKNFNDFVNEYRVEAVKKMLKEPSASHYSLLGVGLECGFNSKSTFNRVFKKMTGLAPSDYVG